MHGLMYGTSCEIKPTRKTNFKDWKDSVNDIEKLKEYAKNKYVFAEDFLKHSYEVFNLPNEQAIMQNGIDINQEKNNIIYEIFFSVSKNNSKKELPKLDLYMPTLMPCIPEEMQVISAINNGGASRGISIVIFGNFVENDEISFKDVFFQYFVLKYHGIVI